MKSIFPKYQQLAQSLRQEIITGRLPAWAQLPTEEMLVKQYGFSRETIRKAIGQLEAEGFVRRAQGSGSFVNGPDPDAVAFRFMESLNKADETHSTYRILHQEVLPATIEYAVILKIAPGAPIIHIAQVKLEDGIPTSYSERYFPQSLCPELANADLTHSSVHNWLAESAELPPMRAVVEIEARNLTETEAQWLNLPPGSAAIIVNRMSYTAPNQPGVWYKGFFKDHYRMEVELEAYSSSNNRRSIR